MLDAGIGEAPVNSLLTALGIPPVFQKTLRKSERFVGRALEKKAKESSLKNL